MTPSQVWRSFSGTVLLRYSNVYAALAGAKTTGCSVGGAYATTGTGSTRSRACYELLLSPKQ